MAMTLRLNEDEETLLAQLAALKGISKHEATRRAVVEVATRELQQDEVLALGREERDHYADLLRRLGE